ncbi:DUF202 domain-containing protein [Dermabacteraceae bacterium P9123]
MSHPEPEGRVIFDPGLQPERTALSWRRTGLALGVGSLIALKVLPHVFGAYSLLVCSLGLTASVAIVFFAERRYAAIQRVLLNSDTDRVPMPSARILAFAAAAVSFAALLMLVAILVHVS